METVAINSMERRLHTREEASGVEGFFFLHGSAITRPIELSDIIRSCPFIASTTTPDSIHLYASRRLPPPKASVRGLIRGSSDTSSRWEIGSTLRASWNVRRTRLQAGDVFGFERRGIVGHSGNVQAVGLRTATCSRWAASSRR